MDNKENLQFQMRQGLTQYIGAIIDNPQFSTKENKQLVVAALCEEMLKILTTNNSLEDKFFIDDYANKPYLRSIIYMLKRNKARANNITKTIIDSEDLIKHFNFESEQIEKFFQRWLGEEQ